jgi:hypothetical protein
VNPGGIDLAVRATESRGSRTAVNRTQKPNITPNKVVSDRRVVSYSVSIVADLALPAPTKCDIVGRDEMPGDHDEPTTDQKVGGSNPSERAKSPGHRLVDRANDRMGDRKRNKGSS